MVRAVEDLLLRIQGEYLEMPGLRLTPAQAQRLWNLDRTECESLMEVLVESQFLARTRDGSYVRIDMNSPVTRTLPSALVGVSITAARPAVDPSVLVSR